MAKFYGVIGFGSSVETVPGVWEDVLIERPYYGDVLQNIRKFDRGDKVISDLVVQNIISVIADPYAMDHFFTIKYVAWAGALWIVDSVTVARPRLMLRLGGVYNGPTA